MALILAFSHGEKEPEGGTIKTKVRGHEHEYENEHEHEHGAWVKWESGLLPLPEGEGRVRVVRTA